MRSYKDEVSGQIISRRQYDKNYGLLKQKGFSSYEQQAKTRKKEILPKLKKWQKDIKTTKTKNGNINYVYDLTKNEAINLANAL